MMEKSSRPVSSSLDSKSLQISWSSMANFNTFIHHTLLLLTIVSLQRTSEGQFIEPNICTHRCKCLSQQGVVDCNRQDNLQGVPTNLPSGTTRLVIQHGNFPLPSFLGRRNMSGLEGLEDLRINYCNLQSIEPRTFISMTRLKHLDLSHNSLVSISAYTFHGLQLNKLYLQGQMVGAAETAPFARHQQPHSGLSIDPNAFHGLIAAQINLRLNAIHSVNFATFAKVTDLTRLILSDNRITQLDDTEFANYFDQSDRLLDLTGNPLECSCQLAWLAARSVDWAPRMPGLNMTCFIAGLENKGLELRRLSADQLCPTSRVENIVVNVLPGSRRAILDCTAVAMPRAAASVGSGRSDLLYVPSRESLNPPEVAWRYEEGENQRVVKRLATPKSTNWHIDRSDHLTNKHNSLSSTVSLNVSLIPDARHYTCTTWDDRRKVEEVVVTLRGPPEVDPTLPIIAPSNAGKADAPETGISKQSDGLEHDSTVLLVDQPHYVFRKQFNMMEMICAVVGTFLTTIFLLIIAIWCWRKGHVPVSLTTAKQTYYPSVKTSFDRSYSPIKPNGVVLLQGDPTLQHQQQVSSATFNPTSGQTCFSPLLGQQPQALSPHLSFLSGTNATTFLTPTTLFQQASSSNSSSDSPFNQQQQSVAAHQLSQLQAAHQFQQQQQHLGLQFAPTIPPGSPYSQTGSHVYDVPRTLDFSQFSPTQSFGGNPGPVGAFNPANSTLGRNGIGNHSIITNGSE